MAFAELEPFDERRQDVRMAQVAMTIANVYRNRKKHPGPFSISDFLIPFGDAGAERKKPDWRRMKTVAQLASVGRTWGERGR